MLTEYYLNIKHLTFAQLLRDTTTERTTYQQLWQWYQPQKATGQPE